jgi:hypothetical protein
MLQRLNSYFFSEFHYKKQSLVFKNLLYIFLLIKCIYWLVYYPVLFGDLSLFFLKTTTQLPLIKKLAFVLYFQNDPYAALLFIIPIILISSLAIFKLSVPFVSEFIIWLLVINVHNRIYPTLTGGDFLLHQLLFFNIFISNNFSVKNKIRGEIKTLLHNLGVISVIIQVCIVYFFAAFAKLEDSQWLNGTALEVISKVEHFSLPFIVNESSNFTGILKLLNYIVLFYQLLFPILVWFKKIKIPFLIIGVLMHLYIAFVMGLMSFGVIMIISYIYFWPIKKSI